MADASDLFESHFKKITNRLTQVQAAATSSSIDSHGLADMIMDIRTLYSKYESLWDNYETKCIEGQAKVDSKVLSDKLEFEELYTDRLCKLTIQSPFFVLIVMFQYSAKCKN